MRINNTIVIGNVARYLASIPSTNDYIAKCLQQQPNLAEGFVVQAHQQTAGKGQRGSQWHAQAGLNISCSVLLKPVKLPVYRQFILSQLAALAVYNTLTDLLPTKVADFSIKWPNDIYYKNKKVSGILIENALQGNYLLHSIVGIGINVNQRTFPTALPNPTSLYNIAHSTLPLPVVMQKLCKHLDVLYLGFLTDKLAAIEQQYSAVLYQKDVWATYIMISTGNSFSGKIIGVGQQGHLKMRIKTGEVVQYDLKEIRFAL